METSLKKSMWRDAAKAGLIIGAFMIIMEALKVILNIYATGTAWIATLAELMGLAYLIYDFSRKRGLKYGNLGFTYAQSLGYIIAMMLFAGVLYGFGEYILQNFIAKDYYAGVYEDAFESVESMLGGSSDEALGMVTRLMRNPLWLVISGVISMVFYGGLIGLFASAFVKRRPDIFADGTDPQ